MLVNRIPLSSVISFLLLLVPALFISVNVLEYELGIPIAWNPFEAIYDGGESSLLTYTVDASIVLGPVLAVAVLVIPLTRVRLDSDRHGFALTITVHKSTWAHIGLIVLSVLTIAVMGTYLVAENLPCILGQQTTC